MSRQPSRRVRRSLAARDRAEEQLSRARAELHDAILADLADGITQADLVRVTGYSRERLRQLARGAELEQAAGDPSGTAAT